MSPPEAATAITPYAFGFARPIELVAKDLEVYAALLMKWQAVQNLVSRETFPELWTRHIADSLQALRLLRPHDCRFLDLGSGGGFPALPMAIARKGDPGASFVLVEANRRKVSFLRTVSRDLGLPVEVVEGRIEAYESAKTGSPDIITSRALANLQALCRLAAPHFRPETRAIFHKGREFGEELAAARVEWNLDVLIWPSDTSSDGALLEIRDLRLKSVP